MKKFYRLFIDDIKSMSRKERFLYWVFPIILLVALMAFYFSDISFLVNLVAPEINREYGLLENIQLMLILGVIILSFYVVLKKTAILQKVGFGFLSILAIFILLEEMNYGDHFIRLFSQDNHTSVFKTIGFDGTNIHNQGNNNLYMRRVPYIIIFILFTICPFLNKKYFHPIISYLIPKPRMAIMIAVFIISYFTPRLLIDYNIFDVGTLGIGDSIGEFTEMIVYYIFLIYVFHIIYDKEWPKYSTFNVVELLRKKNPT